MKIWDEIFRKNLEDWEALPPENGLENILKNLHPVNTGRTSSNHAKIIQRLSVIILLIGILWTGFWWFSIPQSQNSSQENKTDDITRPHPSKVLELNKTKAIPASVDTDLLGNDNINSDSEKLNAQKGESVNVFKAGINQNSLQRNDETNKGSDQFNETSQIESEQSRKSALKSEVYFQNQMNPVKFLASSPVHIFNPDLSISIIEDISHRPENMHLETLTKNSQNQETVIIKKRPTWRTEVYFAPVYTLSKITPNRTDSILIDGSEELNRFHHKNLGWRIGMDLHKSINTSLSVTAGFKFSRLRKTFNYHFFDHQPDSIHTQFSDDVLIVETFRSQQNKEETTLINQLGMEVGLKKMLRPGKVSHYLQGCIGVNQAWGKGEHFATDYSRTNVELTLGYRISYPISNRISLNFSPGLSYFLTDASIPGTTYDLKPYTVDLKIGLMLQLDKD